MATHAGSDVRQGASTSHSHYAPMPGSPTLTNPDMILPDYDSPNERSQSPLLSWNSAHTNEQFQLPDNAFIAGPMTPTTPIIYGNGTMLSDIGEVTEVESVVGLAARRVSSHLSDHSDDAALRSSPTMGGNRIQRRSQITSRERRSSMESTSTITTQDQNAAFADFDDAVSVEDVNFQGDDEESMASEYVEGTTAQQLEPVTVPRAREERYSTNSLSERAEEILANAKRRLTTMEGNLSRARGTLYYSATSDGSTPSPPIVRPATALRESTVPTSPGHSRMLSETGVQGSMPSGYPQRSASALGAAGGYRQPLTTSRSADALGGPHAGGHKFSHHLLDTTLEPLGEDDGQSDVDNRRNSSHLPNLSSPTFGSFSEKELTRSVSVVQMRDLKHQMKDLKGKISSLKEQARVDSMKRRSLQSLRTPSPFTHARWDPGFVEPRRIQSVEPESTPRQYPDIEEIPVQAAEVDVHSAVYELKTGAQVEEEPVPGFKDAPEANYEDEMANGVAYLQQEDSDKDRRPTYDDEDLHTEISDEPEEEQKEQEKELYSDSNYSEDGDQEEDDDDYVSDSGDSLYHDTLQHPVSHEDREDAFDYEHFFLHSAMGTISQQRALGRRGSSGSDVSEESVETTRGPLVPRARRPSMDTMSSVDTFATATEGRVSRSSTFDDDIKETVVTANSSDSDGPPTSKRSTFNGFQFNHSVNSSGEFPGRYRQNSVVHRPTSSVSNIAQHRPSISSFESTGTNRSFPLVNKAKLNGGVLTPNGSTPNSTPGGSPDNELKQISRTLMNDTTIVCDKDADKGSRETPPMQMLQKEDQILVERLVASLGKCVLGLGEASRASTEARTYRRRLDMARKILEGLED
ncbi:Fc.00g066700.m01.CDS01 [Cosmosporella sp. VM-42]